MAQPRKLIEKAYGFPFPDDLYAFHDFVREHGKRCVPLGVRIDGPLALLTKQRPDAERFYDDPPELFTVLTGNIDGLHWGYWFDHPGKSEPVVASYYANDVFEIRVDGSTLFEAVRGQLEAFHRDAEDSCEDDPVNAAGYRKQLDDYADTREALAKHSNVLRKRREIGSRYLDKYVRTAKPATKRRPIAPTRSKIGIVVDKKHYRPLAKNDPFQAPGYRPKAPGGDPGRRHRAQGGGPWLPGRRAEAGTRPLDLQGAPRRQPRDAGAGVFGAGPGRAPPAAREGDRVPAGVRRIGVRPPDRVLNGSLTRPAAPAPIASLPRRAPSGS